MTIRSLLLLLVSLWVLPASLTAADSKVSWHFEIKEDDAGIPRGKIFLEIDGKRHPIDDSVTGEFHAVEKADYTARKIPDNALTACRGTWAQVSKQFYVIREKDAFKVFKRDEDGEGGFIGKYKLLKTLP